MIPITVTLFVIGLLLIAMSMFDGNDNTPNGAL